MQNEEVSTRRLKLLVAILCLLIAAFHIGFALTGKSIRRDSHLGTALEYGKGPIDLLRPTMVGFNATGTPTAQEFPVWQAAAGLVFKITHSTWYGWANIVSLLLFATALWPFFQLARHYVGERAASRVGLVESGVFSRRTAYHRHIRTSRDGWILSHGNPVVFVLCGQNDSFRKNRVVAADGFFCGTQRGLQAAVFHDGWFHEHFHFVAC